MDINLENLDGITQTKYQEFKEKVQELLATYQEKEKERFNLVKERIEQTNGDWDTTINFISGNTRESVDISQLLAFEYCLAGEIITGGKVSFEAMLDKLFHGVQKFRIGNPVPGMDDACLYGKALDDETAIPVTSKLYRMVTNAGAQHLAYFKNGNFTGAVFIYEKRTIEAFAQDENGNPVEVVTDGINFSDLRSEQSLLTNLRQTVFHEWTHNSEREEIEPSEEEIEYEYKSEDGKTYRNYERINSYVTAENMGAISEPPYIISTQRDSKGNRMKYFRDANGNLRPLSEVRFPLEKKILEREYCFSQGLTTKEILENGETKIHNILTEGFVEETARAMIRAIDQQVTDIDESKYPEYVEIAKRVRIARDGSLGENGQTYADFLMHASELKKDLEARTVVLENGSKVDGLHYLSDYADSVQEKRTRKSQFYQNMPAVASKLNLSREQIEALIQSNLWTKRTLTEEDKNNLGRLLAGGNPNNHAYANAIIADFVNILGEEAKFFDGIAGKLGYANRTIKNQKTIQELAQEALKGMPDLTTLDEIEQVRIEEMEPNKIAKKNSDERREL